MNIRSSNLFVLILCAFYYAGLAGCGGDAPRSIVGDIRDSVRKLSGITHYGYVYGARYEATVTGHDVSSEDTLKSAMTPAQAAALALTALEVTSLPNSEFRVCGVNLVSYEDQEKYYYLVSYCQKNQDSSIGFRVPVLLSGNIIRPEISLED